MTNQTEQGAALAENPSPELLRVHQAGTTLANIAYNLAQRPGEPLTSDVVASLDACRREWDAACAAFKAARVALAKSTPEGCGFEAWLGPRRALLFHCTEAGLREAFHAGRASIPPRPEERSPS